jgi:hypothetical protein
MIHFQMKEMCPGFDLDKLPQSVYTKTAILLDRINMLFMDYKDPIIVQRGYRDAKLNAEVGGSKTSPHLTGEAVDLKDPTGKICLYCLNHLDLLKKWGLWMENPMKSPTWVHLQWREASQIVFNP